MGLKIPQGVMVRPMLLNQQRVGLTGGDSDVCAAQHPHDDSLCLCACWLLGAAWGLGGLVSCSPICPTPATCSTACPA